MVAPTKITIDAPDIAPAKGGFLNGAHDGINVISATGYPLFYGVQYVPQLEGHNLTVPDEGTDKVFPQIEGLTESVPFKTYRGVDVSLLTFHGQGGEIVEKAFKGSESYAVERAIQELVLDPVAVDLHFGSQNANPRDVLAALEQYARDNYSGQPVITGNAMALTIIEDALEGVGDSLTTKLGTPVVLAGGYGPDARTTEGRAKLYISGQINLWHGAVNIVEAPDLADNRELALAEAQYAASVDGPVAFQLIGTY